MDLFGGVFIALAFACNGGSHYPGKWQQKCAAQAFALPGGVQGMFKKNGRIQRGLWVEKLTRSTPARRAASIMRTTDAWLDTASAFMTGTTCFCPLAAAVLALATSCTHTGSSRVGKECIGKVGTG